MNTTWKLLTFLPLPAISGGCGPARRIATLQEEAGMEYNADGAISLWDDPGDHLNDKRTGNARAQAAQARKLPVLFETIINIAGRIADEQSFDHI